MANNNRALIGSADYPLKTTPDVLVGAQVKSIQPYTEKSVKEHARQQALAAMPFGNKSLIEILGEVVRSVVGLIGTAVKAAGAAIGWTINIGKELLSGVVSWARDLLEPMTTIFSRMLSSVNSEMGKEIGKVTDRQTQLNNRIDLLNGVPGYINTYLAENYRYRQAGDKEIKFSGQLGPMKNAHISSDECIVLDAGGLWTIYVKCHAYFSILGILNVAPREEGRLTAVVYDSQGREYSKQILNQRIPSRREATQLLVFPIVIPAGGYKIRIFVQSSEERWYRGGTQFSTVSAIRHSRDVSSPGIADTGIPPEGDR